MPRKYKTPEDRDAAFWSRVRAEGECLIWTGARDPKGYGRCGGPNGQTRLTHHVAWWLVYGEWPSYLRHTCDNPPCVNPEHLRQSTASENTADMMQKGRQRTLRGERNPNARLSPEVVREIRASSESNVSLGRKYGVHHETIRKAKLSMSYQG